MRTYEIQFITGPGTIRLVLREGEQIRDIFETPWEKGRLTALHAIGQHWEREGDVHDVYGWRVIYGEYVGYKYVPIDDEEDEEDVA